MISLLIIAHEEHDKLALHLPTLLSQQGTEFEVVVVDMNSDDETLNLLSAMEKKYQHLRHLSLPTSARDISRERLALHLGMRATLSQHVIILNASTELPCANWLIDIEKRWRADCDIMLIPTQRIRYKGLNDYINAGHEAWHNALHQRRILRNNLYQAGTMLVGLNKELFLQHSVPAKHLALKTGTLDIFVANVSNKYNTILITDKMLFPNTDANNSSLYWSQKRLFSNETNRHLPKRIRRHLTYLFHCMSTIHLGAVIYAMLDLYINIKWRFTNKKTFIKKHY